MLWLVFRASSKILAHFHSQRSTDFDRAVDSRSPAKSGISRKYPASTNDISAWTRITMGSIVLSSCIDLIRVDVIAVVFSRTGPSLVLFLKLSKCLKLKAQLTSNGTIFYMNCYWSPQDIPDTWYLQVFSFCFCLQNDAQSTPESTIHLLHYLVHKL